MAPPTPKRHFPAVPNPSLLPIALIALLTGLMLAASLAIPYALLAGAPWNGSLRHLYHGVMASTAVNYATPVKAGLPLRVMLYARFLDVRPATGAALVTIEALLVAVVSTLLSLLIILPFLSQLGLAAPLLLAGSAAALLGLLSAQALGLKALFGDKPTPPTGPGL
jgi:uncharacterized membrane protein YbhN (UPF0104 family)